MRVNVNDQSSNKGLSYKNTKSFSNNFMRQDHIVKSYYHMLCNCYIIEFVVIYNIIPSSKIYAALHCATSIPISPK